MVQTTGRIMTAEDISFFHKEGYVVLDGVIPKEELQPVIDETRLARISQVTDKIALDIWNGFLHGPAIFHLIGNPNLVNIAEQLVGEEIIASSVYRLRPKIPNCGYGGDESDCPCEFQKQDRPRAMEHGPSLPEREAPHQRESDSPARGCPVRSGERSADSLLPPLRRISSCEASGGPPRSSQTPSDSDRFGSAT